jgi:hypothetical protein
VARAWALLQPGGANDHRPYRVQDKLASAEVYSDSATWAHITVVAVSDSGLAGLEELVADHTMARTRLHHLDHKINPFRSIWDNIKYRKMLRPKTS